MKKQNKTKQNKKNSTWKWRPKQILWICAVMLFRKKMGQRISFFHQKCLTDIYKKEEEKFLTPSSKRRGKRNVGSKWSTGHLLCSLILIIARNDCFLKLNASYERNIFFWFCFVLFSLLFVCFVCGGCVCGGVGVCVCVSVHFCVSVHLIISKRFILSKIIAGWLRLIGMLEECAHCSLLLALSSPRGTRTHIWNSWTSLRERNNL